MLSEGDIQKMVDDVIHMNGARLIDDMTYKSRLETCGECSFLMYGSTCGSCGCIVKVRALMYDGRCPKKKWQK